MRLSFLAVIAILACSAVCGVNARPRPRTPVRVSGSAPGAAAAVTAASGLAPSSMKLWLGESSFDTIIAYVEPIIIAALQNVSAPDQKISALGITVTLTDIHLGNFNFSDISVAFNPPNDIAFSMNNLQAIATMGWEYQDGPGIDLHGTAVDTISQTAFGIDLTFGSNGAGQLTVNTGLSASIGDLDIELSGPGSEFFQVIVNMIEPVLVSVFQSVISGAIGGAVNTLIQDLLAAIPISIPIAPGVVLGWGLLPTANTHAMAGSYYPDGNSFGGSSYPIAYSHFDDISIDNYQSYDVSGWYSPAESGDYTFQISYDQRGQLDVNGQSIGGLEYHNPGMCWPEHSQHTTDSMTLTAGQFYPIRLRYQSGCGGGWMHVNQCDGSGANCVPIAPLSLYTQTAFEMPVTVLPTTLALDIAAGVTYANATDPYVPSSLPAAFVIAGNSQMFQFEFESYVFQSLMWSLLQTGDMNINITPLTVPASFDWALNTTTWKGILPGLYAAFPDQLFSVYIAPITPRVSIDPVMGLSVTSDVTFNISMSPYPIHWGSETVIEIDIVSTLGIDLTVDTSTNRLVGALTALTTDSLTLVYSDVPVFNVSDLVPLFNLLSHDIIEPAINKVLAAGFPLPVLGPMHLRNPTIAYQTGVLAIATDFEFQSEAGSTRASRDETTADGDGDGDGDGSDSY